jgi:hypothetical protein
MPRLTVRDDMVSFVCPGCERRHHLPVNRHERPSWSWNGDVERPTLSPSILATLDRPTRSEVCHSFVRDGRIEFLGDCTHALAGKTVDLPEIEG